MSLLGKLIGFVSGFVGVTVAAIGVSGTFCQLNEECSQRMSVVLAPAIEPVLAIFGGGRNITRAEQKYAKLFDQAAEFHSTGAYKEACEKYVAAGHQLDWLKSIGASADIPACRCSLAIYMNDICEMDNASESVKRACRCQSTLPPPEESDCSSRCAIAGQQ